MVDWEACLNDCRVDWGGANQADTSPTRPKEMKQPSGPLVTDNPGGHRESGAQPTPLGETTGTLGPDEQPSDFTLLQGDHTARFDWRVDLRDNTYKYDRLMEPVGPAEQSVGSDTAVRTNATLNLQPIRLTRCWSDDTLGSRRGHDRQSHAPRESTPW